jgi:FemAB-related protein (PEP-CTERM system-associated)
MGKTANSRMATLATVTPVDSSKPAAPVVRDFAAGDTERWDRFVLGQPDGAFFHLTGWKRVIEKTFGYRPRYLYTARGSQITAVVPLFRITNLVMGRCFVSVPFGVYGGICASDSESHEVLLQHVKQLARDEEADYLELRSRKTGQYAEFHRNSLYVTFTTELSSDPEANRKRLPRDTRYMIRKAEKAGLLVQRGLGQMNQFYELFAESMHRHGTPVFPRSFFDNLTDEFSGQMDLLIVRAGAKPVAGVVSFVYRDTILPYYAGAGSEAPGLAANNLMYSELMKGAAETGIRWFDFGRSKKGTGSYAFKTQWDMTVEPLDYQVFLVKRKTVPNFSPVNPKFELATRLWRRLPLEMTKRVGPRVVRWFP